VEVASVAVVVADGGVPTGGVLVAATTACTMSFLVLMAVVASAES
jgi:hypothetical protein